MNSKEALTIVLKAAEYGVSSVHRQELKAAIALLKEPAPAKVAKKATVK